MKKASSREAEGVLCAPCVTVKNVIPKFTLPIFVRESPAQQESILATRAVLLWRDSWERFVCFAELFVLVPQSRETEEVGQRRKIKIHKKGPEKGPVVPWEGSSWSPACTEALASCLNCSTMTQPLPVFWDLRQDKQVWEMPCVRSSGRGVKYQAGWLQSKTCKRRPLVSLTGLDDLRVWAHKKVAKIHSGY